MMNLRLLLVVIAASYLQAPRFELGVFMDHRMRHHHSMAHRRHHHILKNLESLLQDTLYAHLTLRNK